MTEPSGNATPHAPEARPGRLSWYWHRLRAMSLSEAALRVRQKVRERADAQSITDWNGGDVAVAGHFPALPDRAGASSEVRDAIRRDAAEIVAGRWRLFGHLPVTVSDPPPWHRDLLADLEVNAPGISFHLNHRELPSGADIKPIWELSRWSHLVRLAQATWLEGSSVPGEKCLSWLEDWVARNPPLRGWNWTSALEAGVRLIQFTWIDALLIGSSGATTWDKRMATLRQQIVPAHQWFCWRHRTFGSSANNHLLGELAGLIVSRVRYASKREEAPPLARLKAVWEREVLAQFSEDGGNREQALNYQLFAWELCAQAEAALGAAGSPPAREVTHRLRRAQAYYAAVQAPSDPWDYGDSDDAFVTPFAGHEQNAAMEWREWMSGGPSPHIAFWWGQGRREPAEDVAMGEWRWFAGSGQACMHRGDWFLRWDLSPLGYLRTAAHGHLDALHLSIWLGPIALVVDPGTGVYFADAELRRHITSWAAHNGPQLLQGTYPRRAGPFLWAEHHARPNLQSVGPRQLRGSLALPSGNLSRMIEALPDDLGWRITDQADADFRVFWQLAPGASVRADGAGAFHIERAGRVLRLHIVSGAGRYIPANECRAESGWRGACAQRFRQIEFGPAIEVVSPGGAVIECVWQRG